MRLLPEVEGRPLDASYQDVPMLFGLRPFQFLEPSISLQLSQDVLDLKLQLCRARTQPRPSNSWYEPLSEMEHL